MPWEKGVFKSIFKKPDSGRLEWAGQPRQWVEHCMEAAVEPLDELSVAMCSRPQLVGAYFEHALASGSDQSFFQQRQSLLESAVEKWFCIIRVNMLASAVGRDIIGLGEHGHSEKRGLSSYRSCHWHPVQDNCHNPCKCPFEIHQMEG